MRRKIFYAGMLLLMISILAACKASVSQSNEVPEAAESNSAESSSSESNSAVSGSAESNSAESGSAESNSAVSSNAESNSFENNSSESITYESMDGTQIKMITENTEVVITLNASRAAADLVAMLPLEMTLIERNSFAKGMRLPEQLSSTEETTREYEIGDFGYWNAGPDLAIFYDDIYEQTIVEVIPLGHAETGAETMAGESGTVRLEFISDSEEQIENE